VVLNVSVLLQCILTANCCISLLSYIYYSLFIANNLANLWLYKSRADERGMCSQSGMQNKFSLYNVNSFEN
jgi:hypothetical protein